MRHLQAVLLQALAVLQPRYPVLPFFSHAPCYGPAWDAFALAVRANALPGAEPPSLLWQRALPELRGVLESSGETVLQHGQRLANRLEAKLEGLQGSLNTLLQGQVPITFTGYFGAGPTAQSLSSLPAIVTATATLTVPVIPVLASAPVASTPAASSPGGNTAG